jgi:hypothetical protein
VIRTRLRKTVDMLLGRTEERRELEQKLNDAVGEVRSLRLKLRDEPPLPPRLSLDSIDVDWHETPTSPGKL